MSLLDYGRVTIQFHDGERKTMSETFLTKLIAGPSAMAMVVDIPPPKKQKQ